MRARRRGERILAQLKRLPWWATSALAHLVLIYLLTKIYAIYAPPDEDALLAIHVGLERDTRREHALEKGTDVLKRPEPVLAPAILEDAARFDRLEHASAQELALPRGLQPEQELIAAGGSFGWRSEGGRKNAVLRGGGTAASESAVDSGLSWLARHQSVDGGWSCSRFTGRCGRQPACGGRIRYVCFDPGLTGLAALAFLAAGHTHEKGQYADTMRSALSYLRKIQKKDGCFGPEMRRFAHRPEMEPQMLTSKTGNVMYNHAICLLAVAEAYGMTMDPDLKVAAQRGVDFAVETQNDSGGWTYFPNGPGGDTSVTGWQVMALKSAQTAGLEVRPSAFDGAKKWLSHAARKDGTMGYRGPDRHSLALTAVGLACRQFLGAKRNQPALVKTAQIIVSNPRPPAAIARSAKEKLDLYYWYYATLALFQRGGKEWEGWNSKVRDLLVARQEKQGCAEGSWDYDTRWGRFGGRIYSTALSVLTLEVYYRYLPLYQVEPTADKVVEAYQRSLEAYRQSLDAWPDRGSPTEPALAALSHAREALAEFTLAARADADPDAKRKTKLLMWLADTMLRQATLEARAGAHQTAIRLLRAFCSARPNHPDVPSARRLLATVLASEASALRKAGSEEQALSLERESAAMLFAILRSDPAQPLTLYEWLGGKLFEMKDYRRSAWVYRQGLVRASRAGKAERQKAWSMVPKLAQCYLEGRDWVRSIPLLEQLAKHYPRAMDLKTSLAECYRRTNELDKALGIYRALLAGQSPGSQGWWEAYYQTAAIRFRQREYQTVLRLVGRMHVTRPSLGGKQYRDRFLKLEVAARTKLGRGSGGS